ncbi:U4/U6.U5 small nuclear ribonucleoprotein component snu23 like [Verticillium longisporum]|uniref:C2H2-type domain-containing protein n=3 Tax=Verticillium TaxID=1036719 RepID=G2WQR8_VERDV|nr:uncharacterized protein VDAG_00710 [Verticillium dahliae VdLs.17]KAF3350812.1 Glyceraldehyde-3-phosphate dehydrogenase [Verticillium dahliae VDG2]KAG7138443.1 U4/U6.U5 small nuclear ribonucleoprotein component snu23 like [Verticillium longisporum]KAH6710515.1 hypothetical protein EV126DRAFT_376036 [Verticillium dahliae]EGY14028.1 hypothetical protein VDAG_00710 [Verticillium dahliae VdLs.17]PNH33383.1 hypothetical protein BJF96_g3523 [Verticillium dahliae]
MADKKGSAYGAPAGDTDFRKTWDLDEYAAKAKAREAEEREEAKARYEAKLAGKKYYKPLTGNETMTTARQAGLDLSSQVGKTQLVAAGAGVGKRGRSAGFYCEACDLTFKDNKQFVEHMNTPQHLAATGQKMEVERASPEEVKARIQYWWDQKEELVKQQATGLHERLELRRAEDEREAEEKRRKRKEADERRRKEREEAEKVKTEYGDDVRIEGEHEEDDMMAAMGFAGFGTSKK